MSVHCYYVVCMQIDFFLTIVYVKFIFPVMLYKNIIIIIVQKVTYEEFDCYYSRVRL